MLDALLDSWDRNNTITLNLLRAVADDAMDLKPIANSPSIAQLFMHMQYCRLIFVVEDAPEFATAVPKGEWTVEHDRTRSSRCFMTAPPRYVRRCGTGSKPIARC